MSTNGSTVPRDYWFCGIRSCQQPNQVSLAPVQCSSCGHTRDACCSEAGAPMPSPVGRYTANLLSVNPVDSYPSTSQHGYSAFQHTMCNSPFNSLGAGAPAPGSWTCECGASNSGLTPDFCPICGRRL